MNKVYTKGNYLILELANGTVITQPRKNISFTRVSKTDYFEYVVIDKPNSSFNKTYDWTNFVNESGVVVWSSAEEFETFISDNTGNFNSGSGGGTIDPQDYDLADFKNQSSDPFVQESDLLNKADLVGGKVPASQLPSYVDDVLEFANLTTFPVTGETGKLYVALDSNKIYRWSGSVYIDMTPGEADTLQTVVDRNNGTTKPIIFQPSEGRAGELYFNPTTYSSYFGNLNSAHTGAYNHGWGYNSLPKVTSGTANSAFGAYSGAELTTGSYNTFFAINAGNKSTTGNYNTYIGNESAFNGTAAFKNTFVGAFSGFTNTVGVGNTLIGYKTMNTSNLGNFNTSIGWGSGQGVTGGNNVLIGVGSGYNDGAISNKLIIHSNPTLTGVTNTSEGVYGSFQQSQLNRALITGDFSARWVRMNASYLQIGNPATNANDITIASGVGITAAQVFTPVNNSDYVQKQYVDSKKNEAGQVKVNYTDLTLTGFTRNTLRTFDINAATQTISASPTTKYPNSTPNNYAGFFDSSRGAGPTGRLIENPINGQTHFWRVQGSYSGKANGNTGVIELILRNPVSGFQYYMTVNLPDGRTSGNFNLLAITIADPASIPAPNGYVLDAITSFTDTNLQISIQSITRISNAIEL